MTSNEIKAVFDRTFNGMANPIFCHPYKYFEHAGHLCDLAASPSGYSMAGGVRRRLNKTPLAIFDMMSCDCGNMLTVLTMDGEKTDFGGHFDNDEELDWLLSAIR